MPQLPLTILFWDSHREKEREKEKFFHKIQEDTRIAFSQLFLLIRRLFKVAYLSAILRRKVRCVHSSLRAGANVDAFLMLRYAIRRVRRQFLITRQHSLVHGTASATLTGSAHPRDPQRAPYPLSINGGARPTWSSCLQRDSALSIAIFRSIIHQRSGRWQRSETCVDPRVGRPPAGRSEAEPAKARAIK